MMEGRCECGDVRYRIAAEPLMVNCCHCRDCQRITGSAFALNALIETACVEVTAGEPVVRSLRREGSGETKAWRCGRCQTLLWADHPMLGDAIRFVRVGTLEENEWLSPDAHFFVRSKHPWVTIPDGIPAHDTLPDDGMGAPLPPERMGRFGAAMARSGVETKPR
jgi:hypothetical protein